MLLSVIWSNRNNKVWQETCEPGRMLGFMALHLYDEWSSVQRIQHVTQHSKQQQ
jgi:hypothetical protein